MYTVYFYQDSSGNQPVLDYMRKMATNKSKDSRIKLNKIHDNIEILKQHGTRAGEPFMKHLDGEIWELRPLRDRVLFAAWNNGSFILLHQFMKKTQKTPSKEIEKAKREFADFKKRNDN